MSSILYGDKCETKCKPKDIDISKNLVAVVKDENESECKKRKMDLDILGNDAKVPFNVNVTVNFNK